MLIPTPAVSNTERQRQFRRRNPGYFKRYNKKFTAAQLEAFNANLAAAPAAPSPVIEPPVAWHASA